MFTVQDPPSPPSEILLLPPLKCLYKVNVRIPSQRTLSRQIMRNWEPWKTNIEKSNNHRMLQLLDFHTQQTIQTTSVQDLDPRSFADNDHTSVLAHEMTAIEPGETPTHKLT